MPQTASGAHSGMLYVLVEMKITVIGAGAIGSAITRDLRSRDDVEQVQVCDARARALQHLHKTADNKKLRSFQVDVRDQNVLEPILAGSDCVIGAGTPELNTDGKSTR